MTIEEIKNLGNIVFDQRDISPTQLGITSKKGCLRSTFG